MAKKKKEKEVEEVSDLITQKEAATLRETSVRVINNWIRRGRIRGFARYGRVLVSRSEVQNHQPSKGGRPKRHPAN